MNKVCELCELPDDYFERFSSHHLTPKSTNRGKKREREKDITSDLCKPCHATIHATFTNKELSKEYDTVAKLKQHPKIQKWIAWRRKHPIAQVRTRSTQERRQKSRYA